MLKGQCNRVVVIQKGTVCTGHTVDANDSSVIFACILFPISVFFPSVSLPHLFLIAFTHVPQYCICLSSLPPFSIISIFPENPVFSVTVIQQYIPFISLFVLFFWPLHLTSFFPYIPSFPFLHLSISRKPVLSK